MSISIEWAKQLAHDAINPDLDFATMKAGYTPPGKHTYRLPIPGSWNTDRVEFIKIADVLSWEVTWIGYSSKTNTLLIGDTRIIGQG